MLRGLNELYQRLDEQRIDSILQQATGNAGQYWFQMVRNETPVDKGDLYRSIELSPVRHRGKTLRVTITSRGNKARHNLWVEQGTGIYGPHRTEIVPVQAPFLVFYSKKLGHMVHARKVKGQPGKWMFRDTFFREKDNIVKIYEAHLRLI
jgi:hypothetical protein